MEWHAWVWHTMRERRVSLCLLRSQVPFMRTWFANNKVDKFTVTVWFKRDVEDRTPQGIVNNADCLQTAGFLIGNAEKKVVAQITTEMANDELRSGQVNIHTIKTLTSEPVLILKHLFVM